MTQAHLDTLLDLFQLSIIALDIEDVRTVLAESSAKGYDWDRKKIENQQADDIIEDEVVTKEGYISYLKENIKISDKSDFYDVKSKKSLLSVKYDEMPFEISGTTDVVIAKKSNANAHTLSHGIQAGIELKKQIKDIDIPQAIGQLLTANIRSNEAVFIVLTNLNEEWIFFWLKDVEGKLNIMQFRVNINIAIPIIERAFSQYDDSLLASRKSFNFRQYMRVGDVSKVRIEEEKTKESMDDNHGLELFLNRSKVSLKMMSQIWRMYMM
ncbi:hypothetical protein RhiirC2_759480 [Rhizophagus irregularis]|uniref:Crinkler family protein n=1 Tax=Rhizophagus irregularis TaxID=588596 RepID=A0A2N1MLK5_9GLOM|nr:hypothetical protein RhiirC2_759480 [Rhizophagus irregularis]